MLKKILLSLTLLFVVSLYGSAMANSLTVVASEAQIKKMDTLFNELKENKVSIKIVDPARMEDVLNDDYLLILTAPNYANYATVSEKFAPPVRDLLKTKGAKRLIILRDAWKPEQEAIVFVGNSEADMDSIREERKESWWDIMTTWYDIGSAGMQGY